MTSPEHESRGVKMVRECRSRMSNYTPEQRESLLEKAMKLIFAEGYWICNEGHNARICVAKGGRCLVCDAEEKINE